MLSKRALLRNEREHDSYVLAATMSMDSSLSKCSPRTRTDLLNARRAAAVSAVHAFHGQSSDPHETIAPLAWTTARLVKRPPLHRLVLRARVQGSNTRALVASTTSTSFLSGSSLVTVLSTGLGRTTRNSACSARLAAPSGTHGKIMCRSPRSSLTGTDLGAITQGCCHRCLVLPASLDPHEPAGSCMQPESGTKILAPSATRVPRQTCLLSFPNPCLARCIR